MLLLDGSIRAAGDYKRTFKEAASHKRLFSYIFIDFPAPQKPCSLESHRQDDFAFGFDANTASGLL